MFNLLIHADPTAWETDDLMRMNAERFKECSDGAEAADVSLRNSASLKSLERVPALLMYEQGVEGENANVVRYGFLRDIRFFKDRLTFRFTEKGRLARTVIRENAAHLGIGQFEENRTHWAIKEGNIPQSVVKMLSPSYDVVFSFAGENRAFVEKVARHLTKCGVHVFYDLNEEANLWGKDLAERFSNIYANCGRYCILFISKYYAEKMWTRHERRSALSRALIERSEYILPARFDDTEVPGLSGSTGYIRLDGKTPLAFAKLILTKLGKDGLGPNGCRNESS